MTRAIGDRVVGDMEDQSTDWHCMYVCVCACVYVVSVALLREIEGERNSSKPLFRAMVVQPSGRDLL